MKILDNLFLKKVFKESLLLTSNAPLNITKIGIEKSLKQSKKAEI